MSKVKRKTWLLDQERITRVRRIYNAKTETEAVTRAMQETVFQDEIWRRFRLAAGKLKNIEKVF